MIELCTVWAPRPNHEKWRDDYTALLGLQAATAAVFGHKHRVITDGHPEKLPEELMPAMIAGVLARLRMGGDSHIAFCDADVIIQKGAEQLLPQDALYDLGLCKREHPTAPINNGVMLVPNHAIRKVIPFFERALARCQNHWGGDQEAISQEALPMPPTYGVFKRNGLRIKYLNMKDIAAVPKERAAKHKSHFVHFKGETKKWAEEYARKFVFRTEDEEA